MSLFRTGSSVNDRGAFYKSNHAPSLPIRFMTCLPGICSNQANDVSPRIASRLNRPHLQVQDNALDVLHQGVGIGEYLLVDALQDESLMIAMRTRANNERIMDQAFSMGFDTRNRTRQLKRFRSAPSLIQKIHGVSSQSLRG